MEIAYEAADLLYLAICINGNLLMGRSLHHFRSQDAGGAVQSREGLVKLGHTASDTGSLLYDIYLVACLRNIQCGLDTRDTAANHQGALYNLAGARRQRRVQHN